MNQHKGSTTSIIVFIVLFIAIVGIVAYSLKHKAPSSAIPAGVEETLSTTDTTTTLPTNTTTNKNMDTRTAKNGDTLVMNYTGRLTNGTVFDSNVDPKFNHVQPFEFTLGAHQVIEGWDEGLVGMKVGEKRTLTIPPEKAYGASGSGPIPPNSTLIFDVELVAIK